MENEKKDPRPQGDRPNHKRNRPHHKRRGYFIEPAGNGEEKTVGISNANAPQTEKSDRNEKKPQEERTEHRNPNPAERDANPNERNDRNRNKRHKRHKGGKPNANNGEKTQTQPQQQKKQEDGSGKEKKEPRHTQGEQSRSSENKNGGRDHSRKQGKHPRSSDVLTPMPTASTKKVVVSDDDEYEVVKLPDLEEHITKTEKTSDENVPLVEVVGIRFKNSGKTYYFAPGGNTVRKGEYAIVETARGREYGEVSMGNTMVKETDTVPPLRPIIRVATQADREHHLANKELEEDAFRICNAKIAEHGLDMKLIEAQYTFDNSKLLFYFTSAGRVDFRVLVKDLASVFRTRIELRQIGIRDEAKLMGGIGMCGRPLCCSTFLSDFGQVSIKMAKEQNLSLNSAKISGICGRLMCCLRYEHQTYEYEIKRTPPVDSLVRTVDGNGTVTETNPLVGTVKVRLLASPDTPPKVYRRDEVVMIQKKKNATPQEKA